MLTAGLTHANLKGLKACRHLDLSNYRGTPPATWPAQKCVVLLAHAYNFQAAVMSNSTQQRAVPSL